MKITAAIIEAVKKRLPLTSSYFLSFTLQIILPIANKGLTNVKIMKIMINIFNVVAVFFIFGLLIRYRLSFYNSLTYTLYTTGSIFFKYKQKKQRVNSKFTHCL